MKLTILASAVLLACFAFTVPMANATAFNGTLIHDPAPAADDSKAATTRVMTVLINDGLIAGEEAAKLRDELTVIFTKTPLVTTGDKKKDAATKAKSRFPIARLATCSRHPSKVPAWR